MRPVRSICYALIVSAVLIAGTAAAPKPAAAASTTWSQFHYAATHSGYNPAETAINAGNASKLTTKWQRALNDPFPGAPMVAGGRVFVLNSASGKLYALSATTGGRLWTVAVGADYNAAAAVWSGLVIAPGHDSSGGLVAAYNVSSGSRAWRARIGGTAFITSPTVYGSVIYLAADKAVYALSAASGRILWKTVVTSATYGEITGPVAVSGGGEYVLAAGGDGYVYALVAATGRVAWKVKAGGGIYHGGPAIYSGIAYVPEGRTGSEGGGFDIVALQVSDGRVLWRGYAGDDVHVTPAAGNGMVVIGSIDEGTKALNSKTGALLWTTDYEGEVWGDPVLANGVVYVGTDTSFEIHSAATGAHLYHLEVGTGFASMSSPAVVNGRVYTGTGDGHILVLGLP
jgi:outer membrane protein assembly factor BamB